MYSMLKKSCFSDVKAQLIILVILTFFKNLLYKRKKIGEVVKRRIKHKIK